MTTTTHTANDDSQISQNVARSYKDDQYAYAEETFCMMDDNEIEIFGRHDGIEQDIRNHFKSDNVGMANAHMTRELEEFYSDHQHDNRFAGHVNNYELDERTARAQLFNTSASDTTNRNEPDKNTHKGVRITVLRVH